MWKVLASLNGTVVRGRIIENSVTGLGIKVFSSINYEAVLNIQ